VVVRLSEAPSFLPLRFLTPVFGAVRRAIDRLFRIPARFFFVVVVWSPGPFSSLLFLFLRRPPMPGASYLNGGRFIFFR